MARLPRDELAGITGLERELIPVRPPAPSACPPAPTSPEQAARNRAVLEAAITPRRKRR